MPNAVLIIGASGQLGMELQRCAWPDNWEAVAVGRDRLNLENVGAIAQVVADGHGGRPWAAMINAAAYTAVDRAESELLSAWKVNALAPAAMAEACAGADIPLVHVSTDYVFSGSKKGAWEIDDPVAPLSVYGASKLGGELAIRTSNVRHVIVRTAWVVSAHRNNFVKTMLRLGRERGVVQVVDDQYGSPTSAGDLAQTLITVAVRLVEDDSAPVGTFHFSNAGLTSWAGFAEEIFRQSHKRGGPAAKIHKIATSDYPTPARRPANSLLSHAAIEQSYGISPRRWEPALGDILDELIGVSK